MLCAHWTAGEVRVIFSGGAGRVCSPCRQDGMHGALMPVVRVAYLHGTICMHALYRVCRVSYSCPYPSHR